MAIYQPSNRSLTSPCACVLCERMKMMNILIKERTLDSSLDQPALLHLSVSNTHTALVLMLTCLLLQSGLSGPSCRTHTHARTHTHKDRPLGWFTAVCSASLQCTSLCVSERVMDGGRRGWRNRGSECVCVCVCVCVC